MAPSEKSGGHKPCIDSLEERVVIVERELYGEPGNRESGLSYQMVSVVRGVRILTRLGYAILSMLLVRSIADYAFGLG